MNNYDLIHIHPTVVKDRPAFIFMPAGLFGLLNEVEKAGYRVLAINEPLEIAINNKFQLSCFLDKNFARIFSIDIHWHEHIYGGIEVAQKIKQIYPQSLVVVGGIASSYFGHELLKLCPDIDIIVSGYGEGQLLYLLSDDTFKINTRRTILRSNKIPDINIYDYVSMNFLIHSNEYLQCSIHRWDAESYDTTFWLKNGFGCQYNCGFCGGASLSQNIIFGSKGVAYRNAELVASDITYLHKKGIRRISLTHDTSCAENSYWCKLHRYLRRENIRAGLYMELLDLPSKEFLYDFADTFNLDTSILAVSTIHEDEKSRAVFGKSFSNLNLINCLKDMKSKGINYALYFNSGLVSEHSRKGKERLIKRIQAVHKPAFIFDSTITLDPASPMYLYPCKYGIITNLKRFFDYYQRCRNRYFRQPYDNLGYSII